MAIALFGGTFDPVHYGHLQIANELAELLPVSEVKMMPSAIPPHRADNIVSAEHRLNMLQIAIEKYPRLVMEDIELQRDQTSYSIDTLALIRTSVGPEESIILCVGLDALLGISHWHRWTELLNFCHIAVCSRPSYELPDSGPLFDWIEQHRTDHLDRLEASSQGYIYFCQMSMLPVSSTVVRNKLKKQQSIKLLMPAGVINYIQQHQLYE